MGSKRLKAVVVRGDGSIPVANEAEVSDLAKKYTRQITSGVGLADSYRNTGTPGYIEPGVMLNDAATKNWTGVGPRIFFPQVEKNRL